MSANVEAMARSSPNVPIRIDSADTKILPNETGDVIIVMFHRFAKFFAGDRTPNQPFTITHRRFKQLLQTLYDNNFRLISLSHFLDNRISLPAGKIPIVFTFDDATAGQFHLEKKNGQLQVAENTAVGIMTAFHKEHPDFGLEGTFFINMGLKRPLFDGEGSLKERLTWLVDHGFELGNHTYTHLDLRKAETEADVIREVGQNQRALNEILPGYPMRALALPFGRTPGHGWIQSAQKGTFEGVPYENDAILGVGSQPTLLPTSVDFAPATVQRVRAPGRAPVPTDLEYWLRKKFRHRLYVSDGNDNVVTVPQKQVEKLSGSILKQKKPQVIIY